MEESQSTPVKVEPSYEDQQSFSTPSFASPESDSANMMDCLSGSFTGLKLNVHGGVKRGVDRITVEGSPMIPLPFKQPNLNHTPYKFDEGGECVDTDVTNDYNNRNTTHNAVLSPILEHQTSSSPPAVAPTVDTKVNFQLSPAPVVNEKVLVICSASNEHNTGDHQENMLRTALLCGEDGCLRRAELSQHIDWVDSDTIQSAPLCDLLR